MVQSDLAVRDTVLIVDDSPVNLGVVVEHLEEHGYEVLVALGGYEALERAAFALPDLILLDVMMPDLDGLETCRRLKLREETKDIPVIFMTALNDVDSKVAAFDAGGIDYVSKPFHVEELLARLRTHIALRRAHTKLNLQKIQLEAEVEARQAAEIALRDSEQRHRRLFETAGDGILVIDCEHGTVVDANARCAAMFGVDVGALKGHPFATLPPFKYPDLGYAALGALRDEGEMKWEDWNWPDSEGSLLSVEVIGSTYHAGGRLLAQCTFRDIRERKEADARIRHLALHDALTGLPNRTMLADRLAVAIAHARRDHSQVALLLLDLDHFKHVNDSLGHFVGDELLEKVSMRLRNVLRDGDTAARLGGDEFVVAAQLCGPADAEALAERILAALEPAFAINGRELYIGASIGISLYPGDGDSPAALLQAADTAMYQVKKKGRGTHRLFSRDLSMAAERWHILSHDLHGACARGEFELHFQPQILLDTGVVTGLEALLRWRHPTQGQIAPGLFIPLLEEHGQMVEVGRWVLHTACTQAAAWQAAGFAPVRIAVNLSSQQFHRGDIVAVVADVLKQSGLAPQWLELELTESITLDDTERTLRIMRDLKELGVTLSLDDFGTGWSSLGYLRRFPLDRIKIDRSFIRDLVNDAGTAAIVYSILDLARQLDLDCVAEGVETTEQLALLRDKHCPVIQGFLFSQGLNKVDATAFLAAGTTKHGIAR